jgi:hypothetical protein
MGHDHVLWSLYNCLRDQHVAECQLSGIVADGISFRRWEDVREFGVYSTGATQSVGFNYAEGMDGRRIRRQLSARLKGFEPALPDTYGVTA